MRNGVLAAVAALGLAVSGQGAAALTVQFYGDFTGGRDFDGLVEIAPKFLSGNKLPLAPGTVVPLRSVIAFENAARRVYFWGDAPGNRYEAGAQVDRLVLDDGQRVLTLEFAGLFSGNGAITGGSVTAYGSLQARDVARGVASAAVPVPGALWGLLAGIAGLLVVGRRRLAPSGG